MRFALTIVVALVACRRAPVLERSIAEEPACTGVIDPPPAGLRAVYHPVLRMSAIGKVGAGKWSNLDVMSSCTVKVGARIVIGPGQSATCEGGAAYPQSAVNQVFIPNDTRVDKVFVEDCTPGAPWP